MNKRQLGARKETLAETFLKNKGFVILHKNFRCRNGEVDLICMDRETLVFVEVKFRRDLSCGYPEEAVGWRKQARICRCADFYRIRYRYTGKSIRFDVIAILGNRVTHRINAFPYLPGRSGR